jgi:hypothetical protein
MAVGDSGFAGSSVTPPSVSPEIVPESLCQSDPATVGIIGSSGPESVDVAKVLKELWDSTTKLQDYQKSSQDEIKKLQDDTSMLSLDVALIFAGQLLSRVLRYSNQPLFPGPCMLAIKNQWNENHWGKNFVTLMKNNFSKEFQEQEKIATVWDVVLNQRHQAAHPNLLHNYNEKKAVQLIAILNRSPNADELTEGILQVLNNRQIFLDAQPCPELRKNNQGGT